jgi:hypothetical protein
MTIIVFTDFTQLSLAFIYHCILIFAQVPKVTPVISTNDAPAEEVIHAPFSEESRRPALLVSMEEDS